MERSDALAIVVTAVDRSYCVLFRPAAENYGDKKRLHHAHQQLLIDAASSFNTKTSLATQYFPCEAGISRSYQQ